MPSTKPARAGNLSAEASHDKPGQQEKQDAQRPDAHETEHAVGFVVCERHWSSSNSAKHHQNIPAQSQSAGQDLVQHDAMQRWEAEGREQPFHALRAVAEATMTSISSDSAPRGSGSSLQYIDAV